MFLFILWTPLSAPSVIDVFVDFCGTHFWFATFLVQGRREGQINPWQEILQHSPRVEREPLVVRPP
jgi:hypothetical protein